MTKMEFKDEAMHRKLGKKRTKDVEFAVGAFSTNKAGAQREIGGLT